MCVPTILCHKPISGQKKHLIRSIPSWGQIRFSAKAVTSAVSAKAGGTILSASVASRKVRRRSTFFFWSTVLTTEIVPWLRQCIGRRLALLLPQRLQTSGHSHGMYQMKSATREPRGGWWNQGKLGQTIFVSTNLSLCCFFRKWLATWNKEHSPFFWLYIFLHFDFRD